MKNYYNGMNDRLMVMLSAFVSILIAIVMFTNEYAIKMKSAEFMGILSIIMTLFYVYRLTAPLPTKKDKQKSMKQA